MGSKWIWYPGDYEIWLGNKMNNRRTERGAFFPPFWKQDSHFVTVEFSRVVELSEPEKVRIAVEGRYNVKIDGKMLFGMPETFVVEKGRHRICVKVHNQSAPPAIFVDGETIKSGKGWLVTCEDKEWIDESGRASDTSASVYMPVGFFDRTPAVGDDFFGDIHSLPSMFALRREHRTAVAVHDGLYDFGRETFGYVILENISAEGDSASRADGRINICYGESREEALDKEHCETLDIIPVASGTEKTALPLEDSKAFRYVYAECEGCSLGSLSMDYEYLPEKRLGSFRCSDGMLNRIWDVAADTLQLTTREFFIDGIKRDRWVWSGDASQSFLMNYYLFNDNDEVKRTLWLLAGKAPITSHINTIMDYTFFWFIAIADYYLYSADKDFLRQIYPKMSDMMDYVLARTDDDGMAEGLPGDWVFVDWAEREMDKTGQLAFEQILLAKALESMAMARDIIKPPLSSSNDYSSLAAELKRKIIPFFWDEGRGALKHSNISGDIFRYPNIFALLYGYLDSGKAESVRKNVLLNGDVPQITTPYMRFYEMEALCAAGAHDEVMREMLDYWGGMIRLGADTFWEKYNPGDSGASHLSMYGRPYGKSLCHAWGASPIYLLGKYFLGVRPTKPGFEEYVVLPRLGGLLWMEGDVPTPFGNIHIRVDGSGVTVDSDGGKGSLIAGGEAYPISPGETCRAPL